MRVLDAILAVFGLVRVSRLRPQIGLVRCSVNCSRVGSASLLRAGMRVGFFPDAEDAIEVAQAANRGNQWWPR